MQNQKLAAFICFNPDLVVFYGISCLSLYTGELETMPLPCS